MPLRLMLGMLAGTKFTRKEADLVAPPGYLDDSGLAAPRRGSSSAMQIADSKRLKVPALAAGSLTEWPISVANSSMQLPLTLNLRPRCHCRSGAVASTRPPFDIGGNSMYQRDSVNAAANGVFILLDRLWWRLGFVLRIPCLSYHACALPAIVARVVFFARAARYISAGSVGYRKARDGGSGDG